MPSFSDETVTVRISRVEDASRLRFASVLPSGAAHVRTECANAKRRHAATSTCSPQPLGIKRKLARRMTPPLHDTSHLWSAKHSSVPDTHERQSKAHMTTVNSCATA